MVSLGSGSGDGHGDRQNCIRTDSGFVWRTIHVDHPLVDAALIRHVHAHHCRGQLRVDVLNCPEHAFAAISACLAIPQFGGFFLAG